MTVIKLTFVLLLSFLVWQVYRLLRSRPIMPTLDKDPWWAKGNPYVRPYSPEIRPFTVAVPEEELQDLKTRLSLPLRLTPPLENANFTYGINSDVLKVVQQYWLTKYDWRKREARLNKFKHFKTQIEGLDIHFIHVKPNPKDFGPDTKVLPLLISHGWPGSIVEFDQIIPLLTTPWGEKDKQIVFEVIAPSLPGYGFSQASSKEGLGVPQTGQIFFKLMKRLGFEKFYVQGGDWGSTISNSIALLYPESVLGLHLNMHFVSRPLSAFKHILGSYLPAGTLMDIDDEVAMYPVSHYYSYLLEESGYMHLQATKPDTIGAALSDSPMGLAAYILEKFSGWTNKENIYKEDGGLFEASFPISLDRLLDNICVYWFTNTITSSVRFYKESVPNLLGKELPPRTVPTGIALFPQEIVYAPETFSREEFTDLVSFTRMPAGGHFGAMEQPKLLAEDIFKFVAKVENRRAGEKKDEL